MKKLTQGGQDVRNLSMKIDFISDIRPSPPRFLDERKKSTNS